MTVDCLRRCKLVVKQGKKQKKQHLVTPAMLPPHGFSIFYDQLRGERVFTATDRGSFISKSRAIQSCCLKKK